MLKWRNTCPRCESISDMGKGNTTVFHYRRQAVFDHLETHCLNCGQTTCIWKIDGGDVGIARDEGFLSEQDFAADDVIRRHNAFLKVNDNLHELTPRQERRIAFELYALDHEWEAFSDAS